MMMSTPRRRMNLACFSMKLLMVATIVTTIVLHRCSAFSVVGRPVLVSSSYQPRELQLTSSSLLSSRSSSSSTNLHVSTSSDQESSPSSSSSTEAEAAAEEEITIDYETPEDAIINIKPKAMMRLRELRQKEQQKQDKEENCQSEQVSLVLRMGVRNGGCSGLSYVMDFSSESQIEEDDVVDEYPAEKIKCVVDAKSMLYLYGLEVRFLRGISTTRKFVFI